MPVFVMTIFSGLTIAQIFYDLHSTDIEGLIYDVCFKMASLFLKKNNFSDFSNACLNQSWTDTLLRSTIQIVSYKEAHCLVAILLDFSRVCCFLDTECKTFLRNYQLLNSHLSPFLNLNLNWSCMNCKVIESVCMYKLTFRKYFFRLSKSICICSYWSCTSTTPTYYCLVRMKP